MALQHVDARPPDVTKTTTFGILETKYGGVVPGTAFMTSGQDDLPEEFRNIPRDFFKYGTGKYSDIILLPQPSDSPNDPLNWSQARKEVVLLIMSVTAAVVGAFGPMLSPGFVAIAAELGVTVDALARSTAYAVLSMALSLFLAGPLAKVYGRRPTFALAILVMVGTSVWGALAHGYASLLAARVVAGVGMAPYETLVQCVVGDVYYVHERATRIAVWNLFLLAGLNGGAVVAGYVIEAAGFRWAFGACAVAFGVLAVAVVLLVPETAYRREALAPVVTVDDDGQKSLHMKPRHQIHLQGEAYEGRYLEISATERKYTFWEQLRFFRGRYSSAPLWRVFLRPIVMIFYPAIMWALLVYGTTISGIVVFSVISGAVFSAPPYNFTTSQIGLINLSPLIMCTVGYMVSGPLNDFIVIYLTRKNRGVYEPEFRLPLMAVAILLGVIGLFGFGITIQYKTHWLGPVACYGTAYTSVVFMVVCVYGYILDCYRKHNAEAFVAINSRNVLTFGLTFIAIPWLERGGPMQVSIVLGSVFLICSLLAIPLWVYGKRIRCFIGRQKWLEKLMED